MRRQAVRRPAAPAERRPRVMPTNGPPATESAPRRCAEALAALALPAASGEDWLGRFPPHAVVAALRWALSQTWFAVELLLDRERLLDRLRASPPPTREALAGPLRALPEVASAVWGPCDPDELG